MLKKIVSVIMLLCLFFAVSISFKTEITATAKSELDQLYDDLNELKNNQQKLSDQLKAANAETAKAEAKKAAIDQKLSNTQSQISKYNTLIDKLDSDIKKQNKLLDQQQDELSGYYDTYKERIRTSYENGKSSTIGVLLGSDSLGDFLKRYGLISQIMEHDNQMMEGMQNKLKAISATKADLDERIKANENAKAELSQQKQSLASEQKENDAIVYELKDKAQDTEKLLEAEQAESEEINKKIDSLTNKNTEYVGGEFQWPLPGYHTISSRFGPRNSYGGYHYGMDISTNHQTGKSVVAANDGTVIYAYYEYYGGNTLAVDHGGGRVTKYLHLSSFSVSVGQKVKRGQEIAKSGNTGAWTTGPHLHFEVVINGKRVNPEQFF